MNFPSVNSKQSFPELEAKTVAYWKENNTFQKSIDSRPESDPYRFYDGPPFITGTPHYGSLLSSIVKDIVGRYWTMQWKRVERVWGWDCHGLPIEEKVQKNLGIQSNKEIEKVGVKTFIDECYKYTAETSAEWDWYIDRIGRWVDMSKQYRTMDQDYMESVMWVFSELYKKGYIYEGKRVSLYSWKLGTPISNFEVAMDDSYQEVNDPAITVKFRLPENEISKLTTRLNGVPSWDIASEVYILAWTTTPWTIPAHMALAVNKDLEYVIVESDSVQFVVAKNRVESVFKGKWEYVVIREFRGSELVGLKYEAPFPEYYQNSVDGTKNHVVYHADFITDTDGTGIGHEAPEFGDVDFELAKQHGIHISNAMDEEGKYTAEVADMQGVFYQDANSIVTDRLQEKGLLFRKESITHRVPFCPRSGTPLMQKAQKSWFIDIQNNKEKLQAANEEIYWFPEHLKNGRFSKGIDSAPDWCISRTRYWWAPMPVWRSGDGKRRMFSVLVLEWKTWFVKTSLSWISLLVIWKFVRWKAKRSISLQKGSMFEWNSISINHILTLLKSFIQKLELNWLVFLKYSMFGWILDRCRMHKCTIHLKIYDQWKRVSQLTSSQNMLDRFELGSM
jgi:isoleucyl-tRNA synthetase